MRGVDGRLETARLTLIPMTVDFVVALAKPYAGEPMIGAAIPAGWPDDELAGLLPFYADQLRDDPGVLGYGPWVVVHRAQALVVGSAGFMGRPALDGSLELGFGIHADHRRCGFASEASLGLVEWALAQPSVTSVSATCEADNLPSKRVLERLGAKQLSDDGGLLRWRLAGV